MAFEIPRYLNLEQSCEKLAALLLEVNFPDRKQRQNFSCSVLCWSEGPWGIRIREIVFFNGSDRNTMPRTDPGFMAIIGLCEEYLVEWMFRVSDNEWKVSLKRLERDIHNIWHKKPNELCERCQEQDLARNDIRQRAGNAERHPVQEMSDQEILDEIRLLKEKLGVVGGIASCGAHETKSEKLRGDLAALRAVERFEARVSRPR